MNNDSSLEASSPLTREWHGTHHEWSYRPQAFVWNGEWISGVNLVPFATEMRKWMQQSGQITVLVKQSRSEERAATNPYSYSGSAIALMLSQTINAYHEYATSESPSEDPVDAEATRIRLFNEVLLYSARFCEVVIKQLLYCTQIPQKRYVRAALGELLESPCPSCKRSGGTPHMVSWVGTLACPFHLCREFDHCAMDHMALVNSLRNSRAAHSESEDLNPRTVRESKDQLRRDANKVLEGVVHLLTHIEKLESRVIEDIEKKGTQINFLKKKGLPPEECNFNLAPNLPFKHPLLMV
ncbi:hypothetical protein [uncultured Rhodoferax sp.]|uniref:hypothetical protein n=1 Tax=uncultured Rhodoferax sp. TaxID=223188 RepID=UPI0025E959E7|nr:hypothetical protein [uncultured Rhodoferax sp.]